MHQEYLWLFSFSPFQFPLLLFFALLNSYLPSALSWKISCLSVVWIYPGFLTVASVFGEASRWFVVGDECIKRTENL